MDIGTIHGIYTLLFMTAFIGMAIFVFWPRRRKHYDDAANLPFSGGEERSDANDSRTKE